MKKILYLLIPVTAVIFMYFINSYQNKQMVSNASSYAEGVLDQLFKGDLGENWKEELWREEGEYLAEYFDLQQERSKEELTLLFRQYYQSLEYRLVGVVKEGYGYQVSLEYRCRDFMKGADSLARAFQESLEKDNQDFKFQDMSGEEYRSFYEEEMLKLISEAFHKTEYGEIIEQQLHIKKNAAGRYELPEEEIRQIYRQMISYRLEEDAN